jgi:antitoxin component of RelBE/YafQ-DinJ toxin-antitoxin module
VKDFVSFIEEEFKDESVRKSVDFSRCLILQFLTKLVMEGQVPVKLRLYFIQNKVIQKVCELKKMKSVHLNVEIIKFLKALLQNKDKSII